MPNSGHRWTEQEEQDAVALSWAEFNFLYPDITKDAYRIRKGILTRTTPQQRSRVRTLIHRLVCGD